MKIELNHTIVNATDQQATATFLTEILGLPEAEKSRRSWASASPTTP